MPRQRAIDASDNSLPRNAPRGCDLWKSTSTLHCTSSVSYSSCTSTPRKLLRGQYIQVVDLVDVREAESLVARTNCSTLRFQKSSFDPIDELTLSKKKFPPWCYIVSCRLNQCQDVPLARIWSNLPSLCFVSRLQQYSVPPTREKRQSLAVAP